MTNIFSDVTQPISPVSKYPSRNGVFASANSFKYLSTLTRVRTSSNPSLSGPSIFPSLFDHADRNPRGDIPGGALVQGISQRG